jgi:hypothetical protein
MSGSFGEASSFPKKRFLVNEGRLGASVLGVWMLIHLRLSVSATASGSSSMRERTNTKMEINTRPTPTKNGTKSLADCKRRNSLKATCAWSNCINMPKEKYMGTTVTAVPRPSARLSVCICTTQSTNAMPRITKKTTELNGWDDEIKIVEAHLNNVTV